MTTRQEQFKAEMAAIFKKYKIEMTIVESRGSYSSSPVGISFYSFASIKDDRGNHDHYDTIDVEVGTWADSSDFE